MSLSETSGTAVPDSLATPTKETSRLHGLDTTRGIALCGILLMNIIPFSLPYKTFVNPNVFGGGDGINYWTWFIDMFLFEGTMRGLFSTLFGAGFILMLSRLEAKNIGMKGMDIYARRLFWLFLFGMVHSWVLLWWGDILYNYALMGFLLLAFRQMPARWLLTLSLALTLLAIPKNYYSHGADLLALQTKAAQAEQMLLANVPLEKGQSAALAEWQEREAGVSKEYVNELLVKHKGSWADTLEVTMPMRLWYQRDHLYEADLFDVLAMFLLGAGLMKLGFWQQGFSTRWLLMMVVVGYSIGLTGRWILLNDYVASGYHFLKLSNYWDIAYIFRYCITIAHLGLITLFCRSGMLKSLQQGLSNVGRMALSNYISHTLIASFLFYGIGFGLYGELERHQVYYVVFGIWAFNIVFSTLWLKYYYYGPLEWLWRGLTYGERPKMKRV